MIDTSNELDIQDAIACSDDELLELFEAGVHGALTELALRDACRSLGLSREEVEHRFRWLTRGCTCVPDSMRRSRRRKRS